MICNQILGSLHLTCMLNLICLLFLLLSFVFSLICVHLLLLFLIDLAPSKHFLTCFYFVTVSLLLCFLILSRARPSILCVCSDSPLTLSVESPYLDLLNLSAPADPICPTPLGTWCWNIHKCPKCYMRFVERVWTIAWSGAMEVVRR